MDVARIDLSRSAREPKSVSDTERAKELGDFLRARRESLDPSRLGLPWIGTRRTPGLRREEVAQLAEIGITWYTKLEQGRPIRASAKVLSAIANALQCSETETDHLFTLAGLGKPSHAALPVCEHVSSSIQVILDQLDPLPALMQNARFDVVGYNQAYCRLIGVNLAQIPIEDRNCIYLAFTHPAWRASLADWDEAMPRMVALFRAAMAEHRQEPAWERQLQRHLAASAEFRETWLHNEVRGIENQLKRFKNPRVGVFTLQQTNWWSAPRNGGRLLVYVPVDDIGRQALEIPAAD
jgi:transcriptional regulator with XRE-family HTH domain